MDKRILEEYIDACEVIKEAEAEIRKLESKKSITANETVSGSNPEFPYNPQHFKVQGTTYSYSDDYAENSRSAGACQVNAYIMGYP